MPRPADLQLGPGVEVIALTSVAANLIAIVGGILVFRDPIGTGALEIIGRMLAFCLVIAGAALIPAPVRATGRSVRCVRRAKHAGVGATADATLGDHATAIPTTMSAAWTPNVSSQRLSPALYRAVPARRWGRWPRRSRRSIARWSASPTENASVGS